MTEMEFKNSITENNVPVKEFNCALWKRFKSGKIRNVYPLVKYKDIIEKIKIMEDNPPCNTPGEYYLLRKFIVVNIDGKERLSSKPENGVLSDSSKDKNVCTKFYVALEEIYGYLDEAHKFVKHGCRDRLVRKIQSQGIANITRETVELFLSFCKHCRPRKNRALGRVVSKSTNSSLPSEPINENKTNNAQPNDNNSQAQVELSQHSMENDMNPLNAVRPMCTFIRGYIDLIDYTLTPDGDYRYVFLYLDIQTCFCALYPVRCKCTFEIVQHLLNIFTLIGPPQVLHSKFDNQFLLTIIQEVKLSLPDTLLVAGSSNYAEVQSVAENCSREVNSMLKSWMHKNNCRNWSHGLKLVQLKKNTTLPSNSTKSPYDCFFGHPMYSNLLPVFRSLNGVEDLNLLKSAQREEQLLILVNELNSPQLQHCERLQVSLDPVICSLVQNNVHEDIHEVESKDEHLLSPNIKEEPLLEDDSQGVNGLSFSDSSNEFSTSPSNRNLEIIIKKEAEDES